MIEDPICSEVKTLNDLKQMGYFAEHSKGVFVYMDNRKMGDVTGNTINGNAVFQSDNVTQVNIHENESLKNALDELQVELSKISNEETKDEAEMFYDMLKNNIENNNESKVKVCLKKLQPLVANTSSLMTIASFFGLSIPGLG
ncbi:hypothetical protein [Pontibacillus salipaludis]|uniref:Uncharacterized protein n=1 Tax=Pontibacillus salipaludis TaxID=1697394 RepID=A0ABQ1Q5C5_9BACI|nr:hypothetical protein [Pontibacillus salipaludis]GGD12814.1 hypothetical protein GCM10011389_20460 [Pontibacillus salipaludis]